MCCCFGNFYGKFWGNVVGTIAAVAIPGSNAYLKALKVLLPAIGGATGILASGALKDIKIKDLGGDLEDELVFGKKEGRRVDDVLDDLKSCLLYTSPSPRD